MLVSLDLDFTACNSELSVDGNLFLDVLLLFDLDLDVL